MKENRKVQIEVIGDGDAILSVNFDQNDGRHPMRIVGAYDSYQRASDTARELMREADWTSSLMSGDGSVPLKWETIKAMGVADDIPF